MYGKERCQTWFRPHIVVLTVVALLALALQPGWASLTYFGEDLGCSSALSG